MNEEKLYDLIVSKPFGELTEAQKSEVLKALGSQGAYEKMREANLAAADAMDESVPLPPGMKESVMEAFDRNKKDRTVVVPISGGKDSRGRAAWWKYAAAVAVLVVGTFVLWPSGNLENVQIAENVEKKEAREEQDDPAAKKRQENENYSESEADEVQMPQEEKELDEPSPTGSDDRIESVKKQDIKDSEELIVEDLVVEEYDAEEEGEPDVFGYAEEDMDMAENSLEEEESLDELARPEMAKSAAADQNMASTVREMSLESVSGNQATQADSGVSGVTDYGISLKSIGGYKNKTYVAY